MTLPLTFSAIRGRRGIVLWSAFRPTWSTGRFSHIRYCFSSAITGHTFLLLYLILCTCYHWYCHSEMLKFPHHWNLYTPKARHQISFWEEIGGTVQAGATLRRRPTVKTHFHLWFNAKYYSVSVPVTSNWQIDLVFTPGKATQHLLFAVWVWSSFRQSICVCGTSTWTLGLRRETCLSRKTSSRQVSSDNGVVRLTPEQ